MTTGEQSPERRCRSIGSIAINRSAKARFDINNRQAPLNRVLAIYLSVYRPPFALVEPCYGRSLSHCRASGIDRRLALDRDLAPIRARSRPAAPLVRLRLFVSPLIVGDGGDSRSGFPIRFTLHSQVSRSSSPVYRARSTVCNGASQILLLGHPLCPSKYTARKNDGII